MTTELNTGLSQVRGHAAVNFTLSSAPPLHHLSALAGDMRCIFLILTLMPSVKFVPCFGQGTPQPCPRRR